MSITRVTKYVKDSFTPRNITKYTGASDTLLNSSFKIPLRSLTIAARLVSFLSPEILDELKVYEGFKFLKTY